MWTTVQWSHFSFQVKNLQALLELHKSNNHICRSSSAHEAAEFRLKKKEQDDAPSEFIGVMYFTTHLILQVSSSDNGDSGTETREAAANSGTSSNNGDSKTKHLESSTCETSFCLPPKPDVSKIEFHDTV